MVLSRAGSSSPELVAEWPASGPLGDSLSAAARACVQRDRPVVIAPALKQAGADYNRVIAMPLRAGGDRPIGAVALAVRADSSDSVDRLCKELAAANRELDSRLKPACGLNTSEDGHERMAACALSMQGKLLAHATLAEGAMAMLTALAAQSGAERAVLGTLGPAIGSEIGSAKRTVNEAAIRLAMGPAKFGDMRIVAVSGSAESKREERLMRLTAAAMQEAADQGARVDYPSLATEPPRIVFAHAELNAHCGRSLVTVPLVDSGEAVGALLIEMRADAQPVDEQLRLFEQVAAAIGPLVALRERAERGWIARLAQSARTLRQRVLGRDDPLPKVVLGLAFILLAAVILLPAQYRVGGSTRVEGAVQRVVAAPFDGFLQRSHVRPGDQVRAGDLLVEMADQDLALERRRLESTLAQQLNASATALARADRAQFVISHGKAEEAQSQLALVRQQQSRTRLLAPIDGIVIKGDLNQALGAPVQRGDALLTLAPIEQYRLIVEIDERDIGVIEPGQQGQLVLSSQPTETLAITVERVTPVSSARDGRNVFEVEARLRTTANDLRPGMLGVAKIDAGRRSRAWIWSHRIVDRLRLAWWTWIA